MLSTPPAFNLSQNQTLQLIETTSLLIFLRAKLKVHVPNSLFTCQRTRGICPCRRGVFLSGEAGTYSRRFGLSTTFFRSPKVFSERPALRFSFRRRRSGNLFRFTQLVNSFFNPSEFFFQTRRPTLQPPRGNLKRLSILPHPEQPVNNLFSESKKTTALSLSSLPRRPALLQPELPSRSGEDGLCTSAPLLSTPFLQFFALFFFIQQNHHVILSVFETSHAPSFS